MTQIMNTNYVYIVRLEVHHADGHVTTMLRGVHSTLEKAQAVIDKIAHSDLYTIKHKGLHSYILGYKAGSTDVINLYIDKFIVL